MRPADSKLLSRLNDALAVTRDPIRAACLRAERAGYRARQGHFAEAQAEIDALRTQFAMRAITEVSIWICLVDGWIAYYGSLDRSALDRIKRARALAVAARLEDLQALSAAWLAHAHYAYNEFDSAAALAKEALALASPTAHAAHARASLVVAEACHFAGRFDLAQAWYVAARNRASAEDDAQLLSALIHNMAALQTSHAMQAAVFGGDAGALLRDAAVTIESTGNFDAWIGTSSLGSLVPLMRASIASMRGDHAAALELYGANFRSTADDGLARVLPALFADRAWCRFHVGDLEGARSDADEAAIRIDAAMDSDDRALAHGRLKQVLALLGDAGASRGHDSLAQAALAEHQGERARCLAAFVRAGLVRTAPCSGGADNDPRPGPPA